MLLYPKEHFYELEMKDCGPFGYNVTIQYTKRLYEGAREECHNVHEVHWRHRSILLAIESNHHQTGMCIPIDSVEYIDIQVATSLHPTF